MICNREDKISIGEMVLPLQLLIDKVLIFIDKYLPLFPNSFHLLQIESESESEKLLNQQLVDHFSGHAPEFNPYIYLRFLFRKDDENRGTQSRPDIGVTIWNKKQSIAMEQSFFQIECKRLPTPNISKTRSEKEYVKGVEENTGGIERFKNNKHGNHLYEAALIAFVQRESLDKWYNDIISWIQFEIDNGNVTWTIEDNLIEIYKKEQLHRYVSRCQRIKSKPIKLHHFLLDITIQ